MSAILMPAALTCFTALLAAAAVVDLIDYRIPNGLVLLLIGSFLVAAALQPTGFDWISHFAAGALCLAGGMVLYLLGQMGAGDVKLIAAVALWGGLNALVALMFFTALAGVLLMLLILSARSLASGETRFSIVEAGGRLPRILRRGEGIPYGAAIAIGSVSATPWFQNWHW